MHCYSHASILQIQKHKMFKPQSYSHHHESLSPSFDNTMKLMHQKANNKHETSIFLVSVVIYSSIILTVHIQMFITTSKTFALGILIIIIYSHI